MNSVIHLKKRTFSNEGYSCLRIPCTHTQSSIAKGKIRQLMQDRPSFSLRGMLLAHYNIEGCPENHTFCSKIASEVLRTAGLLPTSDVLSPSGLYHFLLRTHSTRLTIAVKTTRTKANDPAPSNAIDWKR